MYLAYFHETNLTFYCLSQTIHSIISFLKKITKNEYENVIQNSLYLALN